LNICSTIEKSRIKAFAFVFCLLTLLACGGGSNSDQSKTGETNRSKATIEWKDFLGVNAHLLWFDQNAQEKQILKLEELGLEWVRIDVHWALHEPTRGDYRLEELDGAINAAQKHSLKTLVYVVGSAPHAASGNDNDAYPPKDPALYSEFIAILAKRYPSVSAWQIWNEPNLHAFWLPAPDPSAYAKLLASAVETLRAADPNKPIVMSGMAYYSQIPSQSSETRLMFSELNATGAFDLNTIAAYHPYSLYPEGDRPIDKDFLIFAPKLNEMLRGFKVPAIWATEWGWSSYDGEIEEQPIIGEEGQANYLLRRLSLMSVMDYDKIFLFALSDLDERASRRDRCYGLLDLQGDPKPAYTALKNFLVVTGAKIEKAQTPSNVSAPDGVFHVSWRREDSSRLLAFWSDSNGAVVKLSNVDKAELCAPLSSANCEPKIGDENRELEVVAKPQLQILVW
jgi:beta-xylosidase